MRSEFADRRQKPIAGCSRDGLQCGGWCFFVRAGKRRYKVGRALRSLGPAGASGWRPKGQYLACLGSVSHMLRATPLGCH